MKLTAIEKGKPTADYIEPPASQEPDEMQVLTRDAARVAGNLFALARALDVTKSAPGNWLHGRCRPSKRHVERMRAMVGDGA